METFEKFTWVINNFSKLDCQKLYSENFILGGHTWRILIYPKGYNVNYLSVYLDARPGLLPNLHSDWTRFIKFKLSVINQVNVEMTQIKEFEKMFNGTQAGWGLKEFMPLNKLCDISNGFLVNNTCLIQVKNRVINSTDSAQVRNEFNEVIDFSGLGKIEKAFVPLLVDVCSRCPSLVDCQQKRSHRFTEWAFTALGRVLYFLKTKKVKDMKDDDARKSLQILWEELETCKLDLTWLEPHVEFALSMKNYTERAAEVKRLKENVAALEADTETARTELTKAELTLDAELGYGGP